MKHLMSLKEQSKEELLKILNIAKILKACDGNQKIPQELGYNPVKDKKVFMLFEKKSTRTKVAFSMAAMELGAHITTIDAQLTQLKIANKEDELKVLASYADVFMYRALDVKDVEFVASLDSIPVIDGCSNKYHPSQVLGDILTMAEISGGVNKIGKIAWLGIENNMSSTLALACHKLGITFYIASPLVHESSIDTELLKIINSSPFIKRTNISEALKGASFVHTDTFVDMEYFDDLGNVKNEFKDEFEKRKKLLMPYQISAELLKKYKCNAKIMHCMPCHEGWEITHDAINHPNSVIFQQAENGVPAKKAILWWLLEK